MNKAIKEHYDKIFQSNDQTVKIDNNGVFNFK